MKKNIIWICVFVLALVVLGFMKYISWAYGFRIAENNDPTSCYYIPEHKRDSMFIACGRTKYVWFDEYNRPWPIFLSSKNHYCSVTRLCGKRGSESVRVCRLRPGVYNMLYPKYEKLIKEQEEHR